MGKDTHFVILLSASELEKARKINRGIHLANTMEIPQTHADKEIKM